MPLAAFAGTKKLTCGNTGSIQIVLDEDASTVLVTHPNDAPCRGCTEPLATATFTPDTVTWTYHYDRDDGYHHDNGVTYNYRLNRMTGSLSTQSVSDAKIDHDNYGNTRRRVTNSTMSCEISQPKF